MRWALERQVRLVAGIIALTGAVLALTVSTSWACLSGLAGLGLTMAGLTDFCPMATLLARMPWNRPVKPRTDIAAGGQACGL